MQLILLKMGDNFNLANFQKIFKLTWLFVGIGLFILFIFLLIAQVMPQNSFFSYFFQQFGIFLMFTSLLMAYSGVYRITTAPEDSDDLTKNAIRATFRRSHYILGLSLLIAFLITIIVLIEAGISSLSLIPEIGPALIALLTVPIFLINFFCLLTAILIFAIFPPLVGEAKSIKDIFIEFKISVEERWINVVVYTIVTLSILFISMIVLYFLVKYAVGVTKAVQWKISAAYPNFMSSLTMKSYFSDLVTRITPRPSPLSSLDKYGFNTFEYPLMIKYIINISYIIILSFIVSFPLSVYFNLSSMYFGKVGKVKK